ncbi:MAG: dihydrolipoyl dehydrogenase [Spirochaetia bacterium]|nr:dihydrolipoyl dehydrogenase [Spirochaetia bacterium]
MENKKYDLVVLGAGPGGYVAAIRASQLGLKTAIVEKRKTLGGTCLNVGCIPTKALLDSTEKYYKIREKMAVHGIQISEAEVDVKKLADRKNKIVSEVCQGVEFLMKKNKIDVYTGTGKILEKGRVEVSLAENLPEKTVLNCDNIIIATGSVPIDIPILPIDGKTIITSDHAVDLKEVPERLAIIGAGVIGLELGSVYARLGAEVTVIEMLPRLFMPVDKQIAAFMQRSLEAQGFKFHFNQKLISCEKNNNELKLISETKDGTKNEIAADCALVAVGRKPYIENSGIEDIGVKLNERGRIIVNEETYETDAKGVYAIGDVIEGLMLAHKAEEEGIAVAEVIAKKPAHVNYAAIPSVVYTSPEIAWVGVSEEQCKEKGVEVNTGTFLFRANARAKAMEEAEGMVKVIADKKTDRLLGVFIAGPHASELIAEAAVAFEFSASSEDIARSIHAHPTLSEALKEAAMAASKWSIHS